MDVQQTAATETTAAAAVTEPVTEPVADPAGETPPAGAAETTAPQEPEEAGMPDGYMIGIDEAGDVQFRDEFFEGMVNEPAKVQEPAGQETGAKGQGTAQVPGFYTVEDLGRTALGDVDVKRLDPAKIGEYWGMVQRVMTGDRERIAGLEAQIAQLKQMQQQRDQQPQQPPQPPAQEAPQGQQPKILTKMSQKELTQAAVNRAREMLELDEGEDLDLYEPEHQMAFAQAAQEVAAAQTQAQAQAQLMAAQQEEEQQLAADIQALPDRQEFASWLDREMRLVGQTPEQVNARLNELSRQNGPGTVRRIVGNWYRRYRDEIGRQASDPRGAQGVVRMPQKPQQRAQKPPVLEGAGGSPDGRSVYDIRKFGEMDADQQEKALIDMGLV